MTKKRGWPFWRDRKLRWVVVDLFQENPKITTREVAEKLGVSKSTANQRIALCKQTFMLPRIPKRQWTAKLIQEAVDYNRKEEKRRNEIIRYGECPNCAETGKSARQYRKLTEKKYWIFYKLCSECGVMFGFRIRGDTHAYMMTNIGLTSLLMKRGDNLNLAKSIMKKLKKGEYVPSDQLNMIDTWLKRLENNGF